MVIFRENLQHNNNNRSCAATDDATINEFPQCMGGSITSHPDTRGQTGPVVRSGDEGAMPNEKRNL